ncbi:hypothetical protein F4782DRAFT_491726 [Xylaria castorea]|nr:hypothetical protein F4782DRAFT_491726 [Xylaria castorea]
MATLQQRLAYMTQEQAEGEYSAVWIDTNERIPGVGSKALLRPLRELKKGCELGNTSPGYTILNNFTWTYHRKIGTPST